MRSPPTGKVTRSIVPVHDFESRYASELGDVSCNQRCAARKGGTADVLVYDVNAKKWSEAALPAPRGGHAAVVLDGKIHVLGGGNSKSTIADHDVFDPAKNAWSAAAPLPRAEGSPAAVAFDGKLYAIGGRSGLSDFGAVDIYNPTTNAWSEGPKIEPRGTAGAVVYCDAVYLFGGESQAQRKSLGEVLRLKPCGP